MADDIAFAPDAQQPEIEFPPVDATPKLPEPVAAQRAAKANLGLKDRIDLDYNDLKKSIDQGAEDRVRSTIATQLDAQRAAQRQQKIIDTAKQNGGTLTPQDMDNIDYQMFRDDLFDGKIDPKTVFEHHFAEEYVKKMNWAMQGEGPHWYKDAVAEIPQQVESVATDTASYIEQRERILTLLQNTEAKIENRTALQKIGAVGLGMIPFREQALLRGNVPYSGFDVTTSGALEDQRRALLTDPDWRNKLDAIVTNLEGHDLDTAHTFLSALLGQTSTEAGGHTLGQVIDLSTIPAGKLTAGLVRKVTLYNSVKTAYGDLAKSTADIGAKTIEEAAADGAGDLTKAATIRTADSITARIMGRADPEKEAIDAMAAALKPIRQAVRASPGQSGQEIANRVYESMGGFHGDLLNTIAEQIKVERIPEVLAAREAVTNIINKMRGSYVRLNNHILGQSDIYWDRFANEYRSDTLFGQFDASYFPSWQMTDAWAKEKGLSGGRVIQTPESIAAANARKAELEKIMSSDEFHGTNIGEGPEAKFGGKTRSQIQDEYVALTLHKRGPQQAGAGWYYSIPQPVREREANWLRNTIQTSITDIPNSALQAYTGWLGWLRTPEETLSALDNWNRKAVMYGQSLLKNLYKEKAESLGKLYYGPGYINKITPYGRMRTDQLMRTLDAAIDHWDPDIPLADRTHLNKGYWFKNPQELEEFYQTNWRRLPDPIEVEAYFDSVSMHDMDWVVRNLEIHKKMSMDGVMEYRVSTMKTPAGARHFSENYIPGIKRDVLPHGEEIVARIGDNLGEERVVNAGRFSAKDRAEYNEGLKTGKYQLIELDNANHLPLAGFGGNIKTSDRIQYVLSEPKNFRERPLSFNQLPRRGAGHVDYDFKRSIKQAKILPQIRGKAGKPFQHVYTGDATVMTHDGPEISGRVSVKILNETRELLRQGKLPEAMASLSRIPVPWKDFKSWFEKSAYKNSAGQDVAVPARLSLDQPFYLVDKGKRVVDMLDWKDPYLNPMTSKTTFVDGTRGGSPALQRGVEYAQQRDAYELMGLTDKGTLYNPLYGYGPANRVDPLTTLNRGLKRIINSSYMDDYKATAVNNWLEQAFKMGVFDPEKASLNQIRSSPFWAFHNADQLYKKGFDRASGDYHKLEIARKQTLAFVGEWSPVDAWINNVQSKLENTIYGGGLGKLAIVPYYGIPAIRQAGRYLRAAVYHSTIGLFNWVQYLVQNMTYSTILGISGPNAAYHGWLGATLHNFGRFAGLANKDVGVLLDRIAGRMGGWKPGELTEARQLLSKTGFDFVGGEHVMMDHMLHPKLFNSVFGKFIDAGQIFFKAGERHARYGAWFTAYKEFRNGLGPWKDRGPQTGKVSNLQLLEMLNRADLLSGNMTTASKSLLQKGPFEFTTQFLGYTLRLTEQMTGKRLNRMEKTRLFATNALLFGIPASVGLGGFPFSDMFRQQALSHRYVVGEHWYEDVLMNGLPAFVGAVVSGEGDPGKGTYYNIGDRLGNPGLDITREAMFGDKSFLRIMGGASTSAVLDGYTQLNGFFNVIRSLLKDGGETFPYSFDDVMDGARILYSVNHAYGGLLAWNTGKIRSKKDTYIEPTSPNNALWQTITGLSSQQASDFQRFKYNETTEKELQKEAAAQATKEYTRAIRAAADKDYAQAAKYFARSKGILDAANYPMRERMQVFANATEDKDLLMKVNWDYYMRHVPTGLEQSRFQDYAKQQQIRGQRIP